MLCGRYCSFRRSFSFLSEWRSRITDMPVWAIMLLSLAGYALMWAVFIIGYIIWDKRQEKKESQRFAAQLHYLDEQWKHVFPN